MAKVIGAAAAGLGYLLRAFAAAFPLAVFALGIWLVFQALRGYDERLATAFMGTILILGAAKMVGGKR